MRGYESYRPQGDRRATDHEVDRRATDLPWGDRRATDHEVSTREQRSYRHTFQVSMRL